MGLDLRCSLALTTPAEREGALRVVASRLLGAELDSGEPLLSHAGAFALSPRDALEPLAEAGRLLLRDASPAALRAIVRLSFRLLELEREAGAESPRPSLLRALAHVGLGQRELGLVSLLRVHAQVARLAPADRALCLWGLSSAALGDRDVARCRDFAARWREAAEPWPAESERAARAARFTAWLTGEAEVGVRESDGELFLGLSTPAAVPPGADVPSLEALVRARLRLDAPSSGSLGAEELESLARDFAAWNVGAPLGHAEELLRRAAPERWLRWRFGRLLGGPTLAVAGADRLPDRPALRDDVLVLMCDVRGYSRLSEQVGPEGVFALLSPLFRIIHEEVERVGGMIQEFVGDAVMAVFNVLPGQRSTAEQVLEATGRLLARADWAIRLAVAGGAPPVGFGVGITKGPAAVGLLGGLARCHLATLGHTVNTSARIEALTRALPGVGAIEAPVFEGGEPSPWRDPARVSFALRDSGRHMLKNISRPAHVFTMAPLLRHPVEFVPMGFVASPQPGVVYLDTGNGARPGVVDNHDGSTASGSACELLVSRPELLHDHLAGTDPLAWEFRLHEAPDLDAVASLYVAWELLDRAPREPLLSALAAYVSRADRGGAPSAEDLPHSLQGIFAAHHALRRQASPCGDRDLVEAGLRVVDAACFLAERLGATDFARIFAAEPSWFPAERALLASDRERYARDRSRGHTFEAAVGGAPARQTGVWLDHPEAVLFKLWARTDPAAPGGRGHALMAVDFSTPEKGRFVISVPPDEGLHLRGLGEALEAAESARRLALGAPRPAHPKRFPADNADPWYFGQGHGYTIVDAPARGSVLTREEVLGLLGSWRPS